MAEKGSTLIRVSKDTKRRLENLAVAGQTMDGVIVTLLETKVRK